MRASELMSKRIAELGYRTGTETETRRLATDESPRGCWCCLNSAPSV
jgi:hypothetical protein